MIAEIVEAFIRAAATQYASGIRQMWLFGLGPGDPFYDKYRAANQIRFPFKARARRPRRGDA